MNAWLVVLAAGVGSYLLRLSMISTDRLRPPARFDAVAGLVAPAAFATLAVAAVATTAVKAMPLPPLLAGGAALLAAARTNRPLAAVLAGMPTYWISAAIFAA